MFTKKLWWIFDEDLLYMVINKSLPKEERRPWQRMHGNGSGKPQRGGDGGAVPCRLLPWSFSVIDRSHPLVDGSLGGGKVVAPKNRVSINI
jgi:hypothetical protein